MTSWCGSVFYIGLQVFFFTAARGKETTGVNRQNTEVSECIAIYGMQQDTTQERDTENLPLYFIHSLTMTYPEA